MRSFREMGNPYQHAPEVSIVRTDTCIGYCILSILRRRFILRKGQFVICVDSIPRGVHKCCSEENNQLAVRLGLFCRA
jgi:hypothetical protein